MNTAEARTLTLTIDGMTCDHCVRAVEDALASIDSTEVQFVEIGEATVRFDPDRTNRVELAAAVADAGFTVQS
ncbi:heavy-metal-associated domain-containing protein [Longibacter sp.]|uniref:heavy-metal-associated domain-containing protein n=1 Tax=Longibacter sp. TaxID=2045415 RepID=UPI003EB88BAD